MNGRSRATITRLIAARVGPVLILCTFSCGPPDTAGLEQHFDKGYGQVEIGGRYAGLEFHHSRPAPSRISFYYPVANSLDQSTDYWQRDRSTPFEIVLDHRGVADSLSHEAWAYRYTPSRITFEKETAAYAATVSYGFGLELPVVIATIELSNKGQDSLRVDVSILLDLTVRTSHTYDWIRNPSVRAQDDTQTLVASYQSEAADSAALFAFAEPESGSFDVIGGESGGPISRWTRSLHVGKGEKARVEFVAGMVRHSEVLGYVERARHERSADVAAYETKVADYALHETRFSADDPSVLEMIGWSKALLAANRHFIDGRFAPMPCPAEYNFFFTHDLLLTALGAMHFDAGYAAEGFRFLLSLADSSAVLPHAYYWKDGAYRTEFAESDSWNHLWFVIALSSYVKHSNDIELARTLYPIAKRSIETMKGNVGAGDLMYARRPDWWDIGHIIGARAYHTTLMARALQDFAGLSASLGETSAELGSYLELAARLRKGLTRHLWDDRAEYLLNGLDTERQDRHYYSGSLLAGVFGMIDSTRLNLLLETVADTLLDPELGVRNAMPPDFHELGELYRFVGQEAGAKWVYFNGAVWPHANVWYVLALLQASRMEEAATVLKRFLTLDGIRSSPLGQPAVYEYRRTDKRSPRYGEIDKPSFLWAGGLFLHAAYHMVGYRENPWNIRFDPLVARAFEESEFDLALSGRLVRVRTSGSGRAFRSIKMDGRDFASAIPVRPHESIELERGIPQTPYLAEADCGVDDVEYAAQERVLAVWCSGVQGMGASMNIVSPQPPSAVTIGGEPSEASIRQDGSGIYVTTVHAALLESPSEFLFRF